MKDFVEERLIARIDETLHQWQLSDTDQKKQFDECSRLVSLMQMNATQNMRLWLEQYFKLQNELNEQIAVFLYQLGYCDACSQHKECVMPKKRQNKLNYSA